MNYFMYNSDLTVDLENNTSTIHQTKSEAFKITMIDTGLHTMTAGRLQRVQEHIGNETFMLTYGDGVSDIDLTSLYDFHKSHGKIATMTSIQPPGRFGSLDIQNSNLITEFIEKPKGDGFWINGGFFVLEPSVFNYLPSDSTEIMWEQDPLKKLATSNELMAYKHEGFWKCMDHLRDKTALDELWDTNNAKWKTWK